MVKRKRTRRITSRWDQDLEAELEETIHQPREDPGDETLPQSYPYYDLLMG